MRLHRPKWIFHLSLTVGHSSMIFCFAASISFAEGNTHVLLVFPVVQSISVMHRSLKTYIAGKYRHCTVLLIDSLILIHLFNITRLSDARQLVYSILTSLSSLPINNNPPLLSLCTTNILSNKHISTLHIPPQHQMLNIDLRPLEPFPR